jgi:ZIP family zinc transporter
MGIILLGASASLLAGLATSLGAIPVFFVHRFDKKFYSAMLGFAAGIMLAASFFSLLTPALEKGSIYQVILGFILGVLFLELADKFIPHQHFMGGVEGHVSHIKRIFLFILAISIHNFPEGLSVGVGFGAGDIKKAVILTLGIAIQNIPEGTAVALPLRSKGYSKLNSFYIATLTGLVEPLGGILGVSLVVIFSKLLPLALSFAAGCMLYVISGEIIPESHREGFGKVATIWLVVGFVLMMILENIFK